MRTRSQSRNSNRQQQQVNPTFVEPFNLVEPIENQAPLVVTMDDTRTMAQLLEAPTVGYEDAIVVPEITAENFELKHGLLTLVQNKQFFGHDKEDPHAHIRYFNKITSTMKFPNVPTGGNFLDKITRDCLRIIESKSKVRNSRNKPVVAKVSASSSTPGISPDVAELKDMVKALLLDKKSQAPAPVKASMFTKQSVISTRKYRLTARIANQNSTPGFPPVQNQGNNQNRYNQNWGTNYNQSQIYRPPINQPPVYQAPPYQAPAPQTQGVSKDDFQNYVKANDAVMRNMLNQNQNLQNQMTNLTDMLSKFVNSNTDSTLGLETLPSNTITNPKVDLKGITTRSGVAYQGPRFYYFFFSYKVVNVNLSASMPNLKPSIPYPSRRNDERRREKANDQIEEAYEIFKDLSFKISLTDALILMPKFASTLKALIGNKEKLSEMARTPLNEHCSALGDLGASIKSQASIHVEKTFSFPEPTLLGMTLELADRSITQPIGIAEDVYLKVGKFQFLADFVVVDFDADPRVPLILRRSFLKTGRALIDVYEGELTLRVGKEAVTFNLDQTLSLHPHNTPLITVDIDGKRISRIENWQVRSILKKFSVSLIDFLLEEVDAFLALEDDPTSPEGDDSYYDSEGDILLFESFLNDDPSLPPPTQGNYLPKIQKELKVCKAKTVKSSIDEPPEVELKYLPPYLEYVFLEGDNKLPVIIAKDLSVEEKAALIKVLKSHKRAIAWKLSDIKGINPELCTHKILMEEDYKPVVQHQRRVNPKIHDVIKKEVEKLLNAGLIYPISDSPWVSPVHCVPKKGGFTVVENDENELIPNRLVTGWSVCIDYRKLNEATRKDHFPLPFMDQMLERLAGNEYYCFLDGFSGYFQIPIYPHDQEKTTFTCPYGTFAYRRMPFGLCNAPGTFQRFMMAIFHDMIEKTMEVFMDDFSVFGNSFGNCLSRVDKMIQRCEDTNLCLNWEKSHFMVKEGIVLGHKISKNGIEVDKAKVDVIAKLPHPTTVKGVQSFLSHAGFYRRFIKDFSKISRPMTHILEKNTPFIFSNECIQAFEMLKKKLTKAPILIAPD
ncbi:reverse transcriptase domain-containing protein [Tanacetum coccineum]